MAAGCRSIIARISISLRRRRLLGFIAQTDDADERLLVVGHNPGLQQLALQLGGAGPRA